MEVERALNSIGKRIFVLFYYDFKNCTGSIQKERLAHKLLDENPQAQGLGGQYIRISNANSIFSNNKQIEALNLVVNAPRLGRDVVEKARQIIYEETR